MRKYFRVWRKMTANNLEVILSNRFGMVIFISGKLLRYFMTLGFAYFLFNNVPRVGAFSREQILLFLTTFMFLGGAGQMLFRSTYQFRPRVVSGDFDFDLAKPISPILRNLLGGFDLMDLLTMPVFLTVLVKTIIDLNFSVWQLVAYILLCVNSLVLMGAIHILVLGLGILKTEVDHAIMLYRDIEVMGRFPVDIYKEPLRQILTFVVPVGVMFTIPAKVLLGLGDFASILVSLAIGGGSLFASLKFWDFAVKRYSSASS